MDRMLAVQVILIGEFFTIFAPVYADTYSVKIGTESHVNLVDSKFLSFTIDPKYLFSYSGKYKSKECICMASSLTPAYVRIAGPSTAHTTFHNATISIDNLKLLDDAATPRKASLHEYQRDVSDIKGVSVSHEDWEKFVQWAKKTGFDLVYALNNEEKIGSMWNPNTALNILTVADKAGIGEMFWQLGYECNNQSIEEYLNDLETLRVIIETFPMGQAGQWRVVGGDVTPCLAADSKSDFKDYVMLSDEMFDAVFLNGNSSSRELERMSEKDRLKLLRVLSQSSTPLWLTERSRRAHELERAADWMTSLGYSARNGFAVHFRELMEVELYEPTLSFYMALLFKNLVGERVLNVDIEASEATMFAHCTSLRHKPVPGAVTLYGANMDSEPARFSVKLSKKEDGGDIMQFILGHDHNGNIVVNGRAMYYEGDIKPVVKRVRPYKTLLINLPPKSFGFWVLANTQVEACRDVESQEEIQYVEALPMESDEDAGIKMVKRSIDSYQTNFIKDSPIEIVEVLNKTNTSLNTHPEQNVMTNKLDDINHELDVIHSLFPFYHGTFDAISKTTNKFKRHTYDREIQSGRREKPRKQILRLRDWKERNNDHASFLGSSLISKLRNSKLGRLKIGQNRLSKRNSKRMKFNNNKAKKQHNLDDKEKSVSTRTNVVDENEPEGKKDFITNPDCDTLKRRRRRSIDKEVESESEKVKHVPTEHLRVGKKKYTKFRNIHKNHLSEVIEENTAENEIDDENEEGLLPVRKVLHKLNKITGFPVEIHEKEEEYTPDNIHEDELDEDEIIFKTKFLDDSAVINISEKSRNGFLKSTIEEILSMLADLNKNLNKVWTALTFLE